MYFLADLPFFERAGRWLAAMLCQAIYPVISFLFDLFTNVSKVNILSSGDVQPIYQRVTLILTIIMVFYVTFEFVKFVVQPDGIADKEKGVGRIVYRMILVVVLIAFVPKIFDYAYQFQHKIIDSEVISKIVFGNKYSAKDSTLGGNFAANIFGMFYEAAETTDKDYYEGIVNQNLYNLRMNGDLGQINAGLGWSAPAADASAILAEDNEIPGITFNWPIALVVGGVILWILIMYCIDLGVRWAQLLFLQIMAPVAIIGYLSPKKDGIFQKWLKQCTSTYLDLFLRMAIMYFILLVCEILTASFANNKLFTNLGSIGSLMKIFIYIVLILGLLLFMKKAPELLKELFPKTSAASGNFGLKAGERVPAAAARALGAGLGATRAVGGAIARAHNRHMRNKANGAKLFGEEGKKQREARRTNKNNANQLGRDLKTQKGMQKRVSDAEMAAAKKNVQEKKAAVDKLRASGMSDAEIKRSQEYRNLQKAATDYRDLNRKRNDLIVDKNTNKVTGSRDKNIQAMRDEFAGVRDAGKELEAAKKSGDIARIDAAQAKLTKAQEDAASTTQRYTEVMKGNIAETENKYADALSQVAEDQNQKYRSAVAAGAWGAVAGGVTGAWHGGQATKLSDIPKKLKEGREADIKNIQAINKYYDEGGTGFIDRTKTQIEKKIGMDTAYTRTNLETQRIDAKIKNLDSTITRADNTKRDFDATEDRVKAKLEESKVTIKDGAGMVKDDNGNLVPNIKTGLKDKDGKDIYAEARPGESVADINRRYKANAKTKSALAEQAAKQKSDFATQNAAILANKGDSRYQKTNAELERLTKLADDAAKESADADFAATQVEKTATRYIFTRMLTATDEKEKDTFDKVAMQKLEDQKNSVKLASQDAEIRKYLNEKLKESDFAAFISGQFTDYDQLDRVISQIQNARAVKVREKQAEQDRKTRNETSSVTQAQKAAADYNGSGK